VKVSRIGAFLAVFFVHAGALLVLGKPVPKNALALEDSFIEAVFFAVSDDTSTWDISPLPDIRLGWPILGLKQTVWLQ